MLCQVIQRAVERITANKEDRLPATFKVVASLNLEDGTHICAQVRTSLEQSGTAAANELVRKYYTHRGIIGIPQFSSLCKKGLTVNVKILE